MSARNGWGKPAGLRGGGATSVAGVQFATDDDTGQNEMSMLAKWNLGGKALDVASRAADVASHIDPAAAFAVLMKVVEIEQTQRGVPGAIKLTGLLDWFSANYPSVGGVTIVIGYVKSIVDLLNAIGVFRK